MPASRRVSLTTQTIFCLIPVLDLYAAYRIKRLRKYLLFMIIFVMIPVTIVDFALFPQQEDADFVRDVMFDYDDSNHMLYSFCTWIASVLFAIFLIRRWSVQWNNQF